MPKSIQNDLFANSGSNGERPFLVLGESFGRYHHLPLSSQAGVVRNVLLEKTEVNGIRSLKTQVLIIGGDALTRGGGLA